MSVEQLLYARSGSKCELCGISDNLAVYEVPPHSNGSAEECVLLCGICREQVEDHKKVDVHHWRCLNESMWSQVGAVQVVVWRMLNTLRSEGWPQDLLDMLYLDERIHDWAKQIDMDEDDVESVVHKDSNGSVLNEGDTVTLIKDLNVKGASFTAKRGTVVRGVSLAPENAEHIEGRVNGQQIVILTKFVKKTSS